jgi:hypothetical protein
MMIDYVPMHRSAILSTQVSLTGRSPEATKPEVTKPEVTLSQNYNGKIT